VVFLSGTTFAFIEAPALGWASPAVLTMALLGVAGLAAFLARESRAAAPMLPLSIFAQRQFAATSAVTFIVYAALTGATFLLPLVLQIVSGYSPLTATAMSSAPVRHAGVASAVNSDLARFGGLLAVAVLPALAGTTGSAYLQPDVLAAGFRTAVLISGGLCAAGGLLAAVTITNPRRDPAAAAPEECLHCGLDAPPLTIGVSRATGP
jgi:hypothetical protein